MTVGIDYIGVERNPYYVMLCSAYIRIHLKGDSLERVEVQQFKADTLTVE